MNCFIWFSLVYITVWFISLFGLYHCLVYITVWFSHMGKLFLLHFVKPFTSDFLFCWNVPLFWIQFRDKLAFFSTISLYKKIILSVFNTQLKFIIQNGWSFKKFRFWQSMSFLVFRSHLSIFFEEYFI